MLTHKFIFSMSLLMIFNCFGQQLTDYCGSFKREPVENKWHEVEIKIIKHQGKDILEWRNKANVAWKLFPTKDKLIFNVDEKAPYYDTSNGKINMFIVKDNKIIGFRYNRDTYYREGLSILQQLPKGLHGYVSTYIQKPPIDYMYGMSYYVRVFPLLKKPLVNFQAGLASSWVIPDNNDFKKPLCPPGTVARDRMHGRGPYYRDVFQTMEGGVGYWVSTSFKSTIPKYRVNGTPNGYNHEVSSPGWGFGRKKSLEPEQMGLAQISNRVLLPPDGLTMNFSTGSFIGNAWMNIDFTEKKKHKGVSVGNQCWTVFLDTANFKGPLVFWIPEIWAHLSTGYKTIEGRGLDARRGIMNAVAMEIAQVPYFKTQSSEGKTYSKLPHLEFPVDRQGRTILVKKVRLYKNESIKKDGTFDTSRMFIPGLRAYKLTLTIGKKRLNWDKALETKIFGDRNNQAFGFQWKNFSKPGKLPQYFQLEEEKHHIVKENTVPEKLKAAEFLTFNQPPAYTVKNQSVWKTPGASSKVYKAVLEDNSTIEYVWYKFIDQPSLQAWNWSAEEKNRVQKKVEHIHRHWSKADYFSDETEKDLVSLSKALLVQPPEGLEYGYVPIVIKQSSSKTVQ